MEIAPENRLGGGGGGGRATGRDRLLFPRPGGRRAGIAATDSNNSGALALTVPPLAAISLR